MRPTLRLQRIHSWTVNISLKRADGLPYSKIKAVCHDYRQRMLASRTSAVSPSPLPPAAVFSCQPTPSYVLSPRLAQRLSEPVMSSLASNLRVHQHVYAKGDHEWKNMFHVEEQDCTPEVLIDEDLQKSGEVAEYYGCGQSHVVGMLDMRRAETATNPATRSAAALRRHLASHLLRPLSGLPGVMAAAPPRDDTSIWILDRTDQGLRKIAHVKANIDRFEDIAVASVPLNHSVPLQGVDPDRTCPHIRLAAAGIEAGPFTSFLAGQGKPASEQARDPAMPSLQSPYVYSAIRSVQLTLGVNSVCMVEHSHALGESDPDLE